MRRSVFFVFVLGLLVLLLPTLGSGCGVSCTDEKTSAPGPLTTAAALFEETTTVPAAPTTAVTPEIPPSAESTTGHPPVTHDGSATTSGDPTATSRSATTAAGPTGPEEETTVSVLVRERPSSTVMLAPIVAWTRYEEDYGSSFFWMGPWTSATEPGASGGSFRVLDAEGGVTLRFEGTRVAIIAMRGPDRGKAEIYVTSLRTVVVSLYSPIVETQMVWLSPVLPYGAYDARVGWTGERDPASTGTSITLDAVEVLGALVGR